MLDRVGRHCAVFLVTVLTIWSVPLLAAELKVVAPNAVKDTVAELSARFEKEAKHTLVLSWAGSEAISKRVSDGEIFDVVVSTSPSLDRLAKDGRTFTASKREFFPLSIPVGGKQGG